MSADILFEVAWKSMIVAGGVVALLIAMGKQAPANRVAVGGLGFERFVLPSAECRDALAAPRLERAIGVVYKPETERASHYFRARIADQFEYQVETRFSPSQRTRRN